MGELDLSQMFPFDVKRTSYPFFDGLLDCLGYYGGKPLVLVFWKENKVWFDDGLIRDTVEPEKGMAFFLYRELLTQGEEGGLLFDVVGKRVYTVPSKDFGYVSHLLLQGQWYLRDTKEKVRRSIVTMLAMEHFYTSARLSLQEKRKHAEVFQEFLIWLAPLVGDGQTPLQQDARPHRDGVSLLGAGRGVLERPDAPHSAVAPGARGTRARQAQRG